MNEQNTLKLKWDNKNIRVRIDQGLYINVHRSSKTPLIRKMTPGKLHLITPGKSPDRLPEIRYNQPMMNKNSLANTNPHLKDKKSMREQIIRSVASSTAIETGESIKVIEDRLRKKTNPYRVTLA